MTDSDQALQICLEELRQESEYIGERLERVYVLQNTALLLTGGVGAIISLLVAVGRQTGATLEVRPYLFVMLAAPWILVPTALMVLRNHFYIDVAERYLADRIEESFRQMTGAVDFKLRVSLTREAILFGKGPRWLFMGSVALAEYAIPFAMSVFFMMGFYVAAMNSSKGIELPEWLGLGLDSALLLFLAVAVIVGRAARPHEKVFGPSSRGQGFLVKLLSRLVKLLSHLSPWPLR